MTGNVEKFEITVDGTMDNLPAIQQFVATTLEKLGIRDPPAFDIRLAADEMTTNVVKHAYADKAGRIWVTCYREGDRFSLVIRDEGAPFDPSKTPPPDLTSELEKRKLGGLGIYFVRRVMTGMTHEYRDGCNIVTMVKDLKELA